MYNNKNLSKLFLTVGLVFSIIALLIQSQTDYLSSGGEKFYAPNSNVGLKTIAFAIIASISFYCSAKLMDRKQE